MCSLNILEALNHQRSTVGCSFGQSPNTRSFCPRPPSPSSPHRSSQADRDARDAGRAGGPEDGAGEERVARVSAVKLGRSRTFSTGFRQGKGSGLEAKNQTFPDATNGTVWDCHIYAYYIDPPGTTPGRFEGSPGWQCDESRLGFPLLGEGPGWILRTPQSSDHALSISQRSSDPQTSQDQPKMLASG